MIRLWMALSFLATLAAPAQAQFSPSGGGTGAPPAQVMAPPISLAPAITPTPGIATSRGAGLISGNPGSPQTA